MCGIAGVLTMNGTFPYESVGDIQKILKRTSIRGDDSCGYVGVLSNSFVRRKYPTTGFGRFDSESWDELRNTLQFSIAIVSNSRAYPTQELVQKQLGSEDLQPFESERFIVSHNGIISNDSRIATKFDITRPTQTDTYVIPWALDKFIQGEKSLDVMHQLVEFFRNEVEGSFAMIIWDKKLLTMFFVTNFMPLYWILDRRGVIYAASEPEMLDSHTDSWKTFTYTYLGISERGQFRPYSVSMFDSNGIISSEFRKEKTDPKKVVISFSGGNDSMVNARLYQSQGYQVNLLHFTYGQRAEALEKRAAEKIAANWGMPLHIVDVAPLFKQISRESVLLNPTFKIPDKDRLLDAESTYSYVANRNAIFGCIAAGLAEQINAGVTVINCNLGDSGYPDNNYPFMRSMENLFNYSLNWHTKVRFTSPLINLEKHEIIKLGLHLYGDFFNTVSCYYPSTDLNGNVVNCGACGCCLYRDRAFQMSGVWDPQGYMKREQQPPHGDAHRNLGTGYRTRALVPYDPEWSFEGWMTEDDHSTESILQRAVLFL